MKAVGGADAAIGSLFHRWRDGERDAVELLEGYAFYLTGVIELYEATLEPDCLDFAVKLAGVILGKFYDATNGGFWQSAPGAKDLILRVKDDYDGAEPSGNSVATLSLLRLGAITGRADFVAAAEKTLRLFAPRLTRFPQAMPFMLQALDFSLQEPRRIVIAGRPSPAFDALLQAAHTAYQPDMVILGNTGAVEEFSRTLPARGDAVAYFCRGNACEAPITDPAALIAALQR